MAKIKIAFVARTKGLEYDDRIRKECISLSKKHYVSIYVNFEDNRKEEGVTSYGIPYKSFGLITRDKLPSSRFLLLKSFELYLRIAPRLGKYDVVWAHEEYTFMFPLFSKKNKCIWDLHEIPFRFERKGLKRIFRYIEKRSKKIIHANTFRIKYLKNAEVIKNDNKHDFIRNFPDNQFVESKEQDKKYDEFRLWLKDAPYVYLQGLSFPRRHPFNTVDAIMQTPNLKAIVVGNFDKNTLAKLKEKYGNRLETKVFFRGLVDQLQIPAYIKNSLFSIVLYDTQTPNNRYCEPNRLFQSIVLGVPVIVGYNEPMKNLIESLEFGISLNSDGSNIEELISAINQMINNRDQYVFPEEKVAELMWSDGRVGKMI